MAAVGDPGRSADVPDLRIVLASASPRRERLLTELLGPGGLRFSTHVPACDEIALMAGHPPADAVVRVAGAKLHATIEHLRPQERWPYVVIAADTTVIGPAGTSVGKPSDRAEAAAMLRAFRDETISVITGVAFATHHPDEGEPDVISQAISTAVSLSDISEAEIAAYVDTDIPWDKAGALELQGATRQFVQGVDGCWSNVIGLPTCWVAEQLRDRVSAVDIRGAGGAGSCRSFDGDLCPRLARSGTAGREVTSPVGD